MLVHQMPQVVGQPRQAQLRRLYRVHRRRFFVERRTFPHVGKIIENLRQARAAPRRHLALSVAQRTQIRRGQQLANGHIERRTAAIGAAAHRNVHPAATAWHFAQTPREPMHIERNARTLVGQVFGKRTFLRRGQVRQFAADRDFGDLLPIRLDVKVFDLQPHEFHVAGQQDMPDSVDDSGFPRVVLAYECGHALVEVHRKDGVARSELAKVLYAES